MSEHCDSVRDPGWDIQSINIPVNVVIVIILIPITIFSSSLYMKKLRLREIVQLFLGHIAEEQQSIIKTLAC